MPETSVPDVGGSPRTADRLTRGIVQPGEVTVAILDAPITIRTNHAAAAAYLRRLWSRCVVDPASHPPVGELHLPGSGPTPSREMLLRLTSELTLAGIDHAAGTALMLHAAGVALPDGQVIALVGCSGAGKSTAVQRLCGKSVGYGYVTDETVAVDPDLRVRPFPKPLALVESSGDLKAQRAPDELELSPAPQRLSLAAVVFLRRDVNHPDGARVAPLSRLDHLEALVPHTSALTRLSDPVRRLADLVDRCRGYAVSYREADALAQVLPDLNLAAPQRPSSSGAADCDAQDPVSYTHLTLPTNREV